MRRPRIASGVLKPAFALCVGLLLFACQAGGTAQDDPAQLTGSWQLETLNGQPVVAQSHARLAFDANEISGNASCNRLFGTYRHNDGLLTISELATTKMMCGPSIMAQENDVLALLGQASQVRMHQDTLQLLDDHGAVLISARRVETNNE